jgi:hypothetical protein
MRDVKPMPSALPAQQIGRTIPRWKGFLMSNSAAPDAPSAPILSITDGRAVVLLNRPRQHNRIEPEDLIALEQFFNRIDADVAIRVLVLTDTGKSFSSGFHIGALVERNAGEDDNYDRDAFERTVDRLEQLRVPTIAALNGSVYGGATDLALACDFRDRRRGHAAADAGGAARHRLLRKRRPPVCHAAWGRCCKKAVYDGAADRCGRDASDRLSR